MMATNLGPARTDTPSHPEIQGYLITTDRRAKVYVPASDAPALEAAYSARNNFYDKLIDGHIGEKAYRRTAADLADKIQAAATAHLYYGTARWVREVSDPSKLNLSELAPAKPAGEPHVDPIRIVKGDVVYWRVGWKAGCLYDVGIRADGSLFNPHLYPEGDIRNAIKEAQERKHRRRSKAAKKAAVTRAGRQELRVMEAAKRFVERRGIGQRSHCYICGKHLTDPESIQRGIGPECWQDLMKEVERLRQSANSMGERP
jgi:hypothetical protein